MKFSEVIFERMKSDTGELWQATYRGSTATFPVFRAHGQVVGFGVANAEDGFEDFESMIFWAKANGVFDK
jgi:hypothetical protein